MVNTDTQVLVCALIDMGYTKWRIMKSITPRHHRGKISYRTVDAWSKGEWNASPYFMAQLQQMYFDKCKELKRGLFSEA